MAKSVINPPELFDSLQYGFSQIVVSQGTKTIHISGQVAWDENEQVISKDDLREQVFKSLENLKTALACAGATMKDVISLRIYIVDSLINESKGVKEGLMAYFPEHPPASTWIGVSGLAGDDLLVEIEATAVID